MEELASACVHALLQSGANDNARGAALAADLFPGAASLRQTPGRAGELLQLGYVVECAGCAFKCMASPPADCSPPHSACNVGAYLPSHNERRCLVSGRLHFAIEAGRPAGATIDVPRAAWCSA